MQRSMDRGQKLRKRGYKKQGRGGVGGQGKGPEGKGLGRELKAKEVVERVQGESVGLGTGLERGVPGAWPRPSMAVVRSHMAKLPLAWPVSR